MKYKVYITYKENDATLGLNYGSYEEAIEWLYNKVWLATSPQDWTINLIEI